MKTKIAVISIILALCGTLFAAQRSLEQLKVDAATAKPNDKPKLYSAIAQLELKNVEAAYNSGDIETGQATIQQLASDCESAAQAAKSTRKRMKQTEIDLRKIAERLNDLHRSVAFDDRPPVKAAVDRIEQVRTALLEAMFAK